MDEMTEFEHDHPEHDHPEPGPTGVYATRWARLGAALLDGLIGAVVMLPLMWLVGAFDRLFEAMRSTTPTFDLELTAMLFVLSWIVFFALHGYLLYKYGQTIGKRLVGTKIIDVYGNVPDFGKVAILRYLVPGVISNIPLLGFAFALANVLLIFRENHRCLHDDFAGTYVVEA